MRILFIGHEKQLNGASRSMLDLIDIYLKYGYEIDVLTCFNNGPFWEALIKRRIKPIYKKYYRIVDRKRNSIQWIIKKIEWSIYKDKANQKVAVEIANGSNIKDFDIIHSNTSVIDIGIRLNELTDIPHIMHIREFGDLDFSMYPLVSREMYFNQLNKYVDKFICISRAIDRHYDQLDKEKKLVIYNGISKIHDITRHTIEKTINIILVGRVCKEKGQYLTIQACDKLLEKGINNFHIYIAGEGKLKIPKNLKKHVTLLGNRNDISDIRKKMNIEIVGSKSEAFGRVTAEAMMGGLAVIGNNCGGTPELIKDGKNGILFLKNDVMDLSNKIKFLLQNPKVIDKIGRSAKKYANLNFTIERCASEISKVYEEVLKEKIC